MLLAVCTRVAVKSAMVSYSTDVIIGPSCENRYRMNTGYGKECRD